MHWRERKGKGWATVIYRRKRDYVMGENWSLSIICLSSSGVLKRNGGICQTVNCVVILMRVAISL